MRRRFHRWRIRRRYRREQRGRRFLPVGREPKGYWETLDDLPVVEI